ncbi:DedA family protein [Helicobacter pullorum]|uniref:DedA family protein n=2 Tax=Helicobacter pullorum TaxID=35818 RepID=A0A0N1E721_9HELI|nr:DedA family protein [Helicobacter pullorum]HIS08876.1 DedA family protein [Candidatus Scatomorpha intestinipullorum]EEQ62789.1 DedA family protein [Helicobacter pullorum MIT 98-5489]KAB0575988.1 DedA family protein [Helicobacter pullorum NCTC 12824]KPH51329.1 membrane protein [Helicobacter pullorum]KPH54253.1 membrane protein [Helicobacter pullorum]
MEELFIQWLQEYGYIILFLWSILEGELGLIMAGIMCHTGHMVIPIAILVAGLGGFVGDQIYFYIGRYNKQFIYKKLKTQRRKFAFAHLLLQKYGWPIIFVQRYLYGMRTIIPMSIGVTRYSAKTFAFINLISAMVWAAITILLAYFFGEELLALVHFGKEHYYVAIPFVVILGGGIYYYLHKMTQKVEKKIIGESKNENISK